MRFKLIEFSSDLGKTGFRRLRVREKPAAQLFLPNYASTLAFVHLCDGVIGTGFFERIPAMTSLASMWTYMQVDIPNAVGRRVCDKLR
jgi:hypothetical protein